MPNKSSPSLERGQVINLGGTVSGVSRRRFLKALAIGGAGVFGLKDAITRAYGKEPDGVPIVHTYDIYGNPNRVRIISKERYRRIQTVAELGQNNFIDEYQNVNGISIKRQSKSEDDISIHLYLDENSYRKRQVLPSQIQNVPVSYEERPIESGGDDCDWRHGRRDVMRGGLAIGPDGGGYGTIGLICRDRDTNSAVAITADHVMEGAYRMYQPDTSHDNSRSIGTFSERGQAMDVTKYDISNGVTVDLRGTVRDDVPDITGTWSYPGLADQTDGGSVYCMLSGARNCRLTNSCVDAVIDGNRAQYQANMRYDRCQGGDSGSPWVDNNGNLLAIHSGWQSSNYDSWDAAAIGEQALDWVDAQLY